MPTEIVEYINLVFRVFRATLVILNTVVIAAALYYMISGRGLGYHKLFISSGALISLGVIAILVAILGIVAAVWWGHKTKLHLSLILGYIGASLAFMLIGAILAAIYVRNQNGYDIAFTVIAVVLSAMLLLSSIGFAYAVKKTKVLRRLNVVTA